MRRTMRGLWILFLLWGVPVQALTGYLTTGYGRGGSSLSPLTGHQNYDIGAGSGLFITGGLRLPVSPTYPHRFEAQLGLGYLFQDDARQDEDRVSWSRVPIEALYFYRHVPERFRLGWGITDHVDNRLSARGINASAATRVDDAWGWMVHLEKLWPMHAASGGSWGIGFRYLWIRYRSPGFSDSADGSSGFLTLSLLGAEDAESTSSSEGP